MEISSNDILIDIFQQPTEKINISFKKTLKFLNDSKGKRDFFRRIRKEFAFTRLRRRFFTHYNDVLTTDIFFYGFIKNATAAYPIQAPTSIVYF